MNIEIVEQIKATPTKYTYKEWAKLANVTYRTMHQFFYRNGLKGKDSGYRKTPIVFEYIMEHSMEKTALEWADYYNITEHQIRHYISYRGIKVKSGFGAKIKAKKEKALLIDTTPLAPNMIDFQWVHPTLADYGLGLKTSHNG